MFFRQIQENEKNIVSRDLTAISRENRSGTGIAGSSALREVDALSDLDNVTVRIADVAANLAVPFLRLGDELGSSTSP